MSATAAPPKKTLYHSELVQMGDVLVTIKSDVSPSKYANQRPYVMMLMQDGTERTYATENETCELALASFKGTTLMLRATGSRKDAVIETWNPPEGTEAPPPQRAAAPPPRQNQPPPQRTAGPPPRAAAPAQRPAAAPAPQQRATPGPSIKFEDAQMQSEQLAARVIESVERVAQWQMATSKTGEPMTVEEQRALRDRFWICWERMGYLGQMPVEPILAAEPQQQQEGQ